MPSRRSAAPWIPIAATRSLRSCLRVHSVHPTCELPMPRALKAKSFGRRREVAWHTRSARPPVRHPARPASTVPPTPREAVCARICEQRARQRHPPRRHAARRGSSASLAACSRSHDLLASRRAICSRGCWRLDGCCGRLQRLLRLAGGLYALHGSCECFSHTNLLTPSLRLPSFRARGIGARIALPTPSLCCPSHMCNCEGAVVATHSISQLRMPPAQTRRRSRAQCDRSCVDVASHAHAPACRRAPGLDVWPPRPDTWPWGTPCCPSRR